MPASRIASSRLLGLLLALAGAAGCPVGNPSGAGEEAGDGADDGEKLADLDASELADVCDDLNAELSARFGNQRLAAYECTLLYVDSGDNLACVQGVEDCVSSAPEVRPGAPRPPQFEIDAQECAFLGDCTASLTAFDTCISDRFAETERLLSLMSCQLANDPEALEAARRQIAAGPRVPSSCATVDRACPGVL